MSGPVEFVLAPNILKGVQNIGGVSIYLLTFCPQTGDERKRKKIKRCLVAYGKEEKIIFTPSKSNFARHCTVLYHYKQHFF